MHTPVRLRGKMQTDMNRLKRTKHKTKVSWITGILFFVMLGMGVASINFMVQFNKELKEIAKEDMPIMELITQITIHKLEQTHWFERALRHGEAVVHRQGNNEENARLFRVAKDEFIKISIKLNEEFNNAARMSGKAQKSAYTEHLKNELGNIEEFLKSMEKEYGEYNKHIVELFASFEKGNILEAENLINETEKLDDDFNYRLEAFLIEVEKSARHSLLSVGEHEDKAIFIMTTITSISLLIMGVYILFIAIFASRGRSMSRGIGVNDKSV
jgi:methyl-accepting chemotaxis protein